MWVRGAGGANYAAAHTGRLYTVTTDPDSVDDVWFGALDFEEMSPIVVLYNPAASGRRATILNAFFTVTNIPGDEVHFRIMTDRSNRYVTFSGVARTPANGNTSHQGETGHVSTMEFYDEEPDLESSTFTDLETPAVASSPQGHDYGMLPVGQGNSGSFDVAGSIVLQPSDVCMVYAWALVNQPQGKYVFRWLEEVI